MLGTRGIRDTERALDEVIALEGRKQAVTLESTDAQEFDTAKHLRQAGISREDLLYTYLES